MDTNNKLPFLSKSLTELLIELVSINSVYGAEKDLCDHIHNLIITMVPPERITRIGNNLVVAPQPPPEGNHALPHTHPLPMVLLGHIDTVAQSAENPNPLRIQGDLIYGLGTSDMKAGIAVMLAILATMPHKAPAMVFYDKEEGSYQDSGLETVLAHHPWLHKAGLAILLEPTANQVQLGCLGTLHTTVTFRGTSCHSARPWLGKNPIHMAGPLICRVMEWSAPTTTIDNMEFREALSITQAGGAAKTRNVTPDTFTLNINYRFAPGKTVEEAAQTVRDLVYQSVKHHHQSGEGCAEGDVEIEFVDLAPAGMIPENNPFLADLINKSSITPGAKQAWTDVSRLGLHGIDAVCFGPGFPEQAHKADEHTSITNLNHSLELLSSFISESGI